MMNTHSALSFATNASNDAATARKTNEAVHDDQVNFDESTRGVHSSIGIRINFCLSVRTNIKTVACADLACIVKAPDATHYKYGYRGETNQATSQSLKFLGEFSTAHS